MDGLGAIFQDATSSPASLSSKARSNSYPGGGRRLHSQRQQPQRIIKKHLKQKYLLCGFAIHAFLASPVYMYGIVVDYDRKLVVRIWPAILYQAVGQITRAILLHSGEKWKEKIPTKLENRKVFFIGTLMTCFAVIFYGFFFTSAWIRISATTQIISVIFYGIFGGIGSSMIYFRTHQILEAVRPKEDKYVRETIRICGEAFCQIFLSFVFTSLRVLYGTSQTFVLMGALLINLVPLALLVTREYDEKDDIEMKIKDNQMQLKPMPATESVSSSPSSSSAAQHVDVIPSNYEANRLLNRQYSPDQNDGIEQYPKTWRNPRNFNGLEVNSNNYMNAIYPDESYAGNFNENGVDIMEIIPEEDENVSMMRSSCGTIYVNRPTEDQQTISIKSGHSLSNNIQNFHVNEMQDSNFGKFQKFSKDITNQMLGNMTENVVNPLQKAVVISILYPATFLQSADIFSYVMCLIVLPGLAVDYHALKFAEIPFLFSLLAFPWMCFALMTPRFGDDLVKRKVKWHVLGCASKALSLMFISVSSYKLLLSLAAVLLGFGQAVSMFLQDLILESGISKAQWMDVKYPMYSTNGCLVILWGILAHLVIVNFGFQASVAFSAGLYTLSVILWYCVFTAKYFIKRLN